MFYTIETEVAEVEGIAGRKADFTFRFSVSGKNKTSTREKLR